MIKALRLLLIPVFILTVQTAIGQPVIFYFDPLSGPVGTTVTITGTGFDTNKDNNIVYFGAVRAGVLQSSATVLKVTVPVGATYVPITVTVKGLTAYAIKPFIVTSLVQKAIDVNTYNARKAFKSSGSARILLYDMDGDGKPDIMDAITNTISVLRNISKRGVIDFAPKYDVQLGMSSLAISAVADMNGDGKLDLIVPDRNNNKVHVFINNSTIGVIQFAPGVSFGTSPTPNAVTVTDMNADGKPDIIVQCVDALSIFKNIMTDVFGVSSLSKTTFVTTISDYSGGISNIDLNKDGKPDIVFTDSQNDKMSVLKNTSDAINITFATRVDFVTGDYPYAISIGDMNADGLPDMAIGNSGPDKTISVFRNNTPDGGAISFSAITVPINGQCNDLAIGDLDGDGKLDLAATTNLNTVCVFKNNGVNLSNISFASRVDYTTTVRMQGVAIGDLDGDDKMDIALGEVNDNAQYFSIMRHKRPFIIDQSFNPTYQKGTSFTLSVTLSDDNLSVGDAVRFRSKGISETATALKNETITGIAKKYEKVISAAELTDPIGYSYSFEATSQVGMGTIVIVDSAKGNAYIRYPASSNEQVIPSLSFGNQVSNYQIVAVPLQLSNKAVSSVFSALIPYNKKKWRLFDYADNNTREYDNFSTIEPGKGYWLIVKSDTTINPGEGQTVEVTTLNPFIINLTVGWNLIGNPYNFNVSWDEVLAANPGITGVDGELKNFTAGALTRGKILAKYRGAFVHSESAVSIKIPVKRNTAAGRLNQETVITNALDQSNWEVKLRLKQGDLSNELGGIGMHPLAKLKGKDKYDEASVPLPEGLGLFELAYPHPEAFTDFNKDVVPTQDNFTWNFNVNRSSNTSNIELTWANDYFGDNKKQLKLFDPSSLELVDMRTTNRFTVSARTEKLIILYGDDEYINHALDKQLPWLGNAYPNPAKGELTIPFRVSESQNLKLVLINIYNSLGVAIATPVNETLATGNYEVKWQPQHESGLYFVKMKIGQQETKSKKIIIE